MDRKDSFSDVIIFVSILVVILGVMGYVLYGQLNRMVALNNEAEALSLVVKQDSSTFNSLVKLKSEFPIYEKRLSVFNKLIPGKLSEASIAVYVEDSAQKSNAEIASINFEPAIAKSGYFEKTFSATIHSNYNGAMVFLDNIQNGERLVSLDTVDITKNQKDESEIVLKITARMFFTTSGS